MNKGVILAGGLGTRLRPLTLVQNKHLLPVYSKPMIYYPIETLVKAGIKEIAIVVGGPFAGNFIQVLKNGEDFNLNHMEYVYQEGEGGISQALSLTRRFAGGEGIAVILGDNCTDADISNEISNFQGGAQIFLKKVNDPGKFGVPVFNGLDIVKIEEKPKKPQSNFAVIGLYLYDSTVFDRIKELKPSSRGELEVTDLNNSYLRDGKLQWTELNGYWQDCGSFETLIETGTYYRNVATRGKER